VAGPFHLCCLAWTKHRPNGILSGMAQRKGQGKNVHTREEQGTLHDAPSSLVAASKGAPASYLKSKTLYSSAAAKARRTKLIAAMNAGWSEQSERALAAIAAKFTSNR